MKLALNVFKVVPSKTSPQIDKVGVSDIICEDVSKIEFDETHMHVYFNTGSEEIIPLRSNDGEHNEDWRAFNLFVTRKFLEVDMSK